MGYREVLGSRTRYSGDNGDWLYLFFFYFGVLEFCGGFPMMMFMLCAGRLLLDMNVDSSNNCKRTKKS